MLTRRTATVTISAPDASTAAAFSSRLLYLPVPTISREREGPPGDGPGVGLDACCAVTQPPPTKWTISIVIAVLDTDLAQRRARHDLQVALDRDAQRIESQVRRRIWAMLTIRSAPGGARR